MGKKQQKRKKGAASNPKYCYEWAFVQDNIVVLSLWHEEMNENDGKITYNINILNGAQKQRKSQWILRPQKVDEAIRTAFKKELPIHVIVCSGKRREIDNPNSPPSKVKFRELDSVPWAITEYDYSTGECALERGVSPAHFVDQFSVSQEPNAKPEKRTVTGSAYIRDPKVRALALNRARGKCEFCKEPGFNMENGAIYLETHHVVSLKDAGADNIYNVIALCPNDHRRAHHGANKLEIQKKLQALLQKNPNNLLQ